MITDYPSILKYRAHTHPYRTAYIFEGTTYSYARYYREAVQTANYLHSLGIKKGERIGIIDLNNATVVNLITGALLIGVIPVSVNWRSMPAELAFVADDAAIEHFFYGPYFKTLIKTASFPSSVHLHETEEVTPAFKNEAAEAYNVLISSDDVCLILYTSGTTGNPKGVMLTYANLYACYQLCVTDTPGFVPDAKNLVAGPLYSIFGFGAFFSCIYAGATNVLIRMFEPSFVCKIIVAEKITNALLVPIMMKMMMAVEGVDLMDFSSLKHIQYGGSPISPLLLLKAYELFSCYFTQVYGLTETAGVASSLRFDDHTKILASKNILENKQLSSAGKPGIGVEIKIIDDNGNVAAINEPGEFYIKGDNVAKGYWNKTGNALDEFQKDGWLKSSDIGYMDEEGFLYLVDRKNDKIVSKGVNIFPAEIEKVLELHPGFREVAVVGIPDEKAGEAICAVAVLRNEDISLSDLQSWCKGKMADYKIPKRLETSKELPRNQTGKLLRRLIREPFWAGEQRKIKG